jgi:PAS domain S-box-containing protein
MLITGPYISRSTGEPTIALTRRIDNPDGSFGGVVAGAIRLGYFEQMFARLNLGADAVFRLQMLSGATILRVPPVPDAPTYDKLRPTEGASLEKGILVSYTARSVLDNRDRLFTYQRIGPYPLVVGLGFATASLYGEWLNQTIVIATFLVLLTLLACVLCVRLRDEFARRLRSEYEVGQAAARVAMLADHASDLIVQIGPDRHPRFVSAACERLLGVPARAMVAAPANQFVHPEDAAIADAAIQTALSGQETGLACYRMLAADGTWRQVEATGRPLPADGGLGGGAIFLIRDVTERSRLEERLRHAQRMEAVGQLTAGVAHDFNNMLQAQMSCLEKLGDEVAGLPAPSKLVDEAVAMAERGSRMTQQLLSFSRQQALRPAPVALEQVLPHLAALFQQMLGARIKVSSSVDTGTPHVFIDGSYFEAALLNLALNARDAMPVGGRLRFMAFRHDKRVAGLPAELDPERGYVCVVVADDGVGMDEATLLRACDPFFTTKGAGGTGLGLASVHGFVRQSGGEMRITSEIGVGTRVELWLPASEAMAGTAGEGPSAVPGAGSARILLVDDEPGVLAAVQTVLVHAGYQIDTARDAEEAMALMASTRPFDALVTDFMLPGQDGADLIKLARERWPGIATVLITGWGGTQRMKQLPPETEVVKKPFKRGELISCIQRALAGGAMVAMADGPEGGLS